MGNGCCGHKAIEVRVAEEQRKDERISMRKKNLFLTQSHESSFIDYSTPRSGKLIKWKRGELIGEGAFAKVYQCMNTGTGQLLAVKSFAVTVTQIVDDPKGIQKQFSQMLQEISLLRALEHPNVVHYYQTDLSEDMTTIDVLLEFVPGGSLKRLLQKYGGLEEGVIRHYARQLLKGLSFLHQHEIIHRDLKSANVLVTPNGIVKLTDFGSSHRFEGVELRISHSMKGSPYWMSPEVVNRRGHSYPADIWSFGCVLIEMVTGSPPWSNISRDAREILEIIATPRALPTFPQCSDTLLDVIKACINRRASERPVADALLRFPFFAEGVEDDKSDSD